jgi:integrase
MAARDKLNAAIAGVSVQAPVDPAVVPTVGQLLALWLERDVAGRDLAPSTLVVHRWAANLWTEAAGAVPVDRLTVSVVEDGLELIHRRHGLGRASLVKARSSLHQALRFAVRRGWITSNATADALLPADAQRGTKRTALTPADARRLLAQLDDEPLGLMWALCLRVGLRPGEAAALHWSDLDLRRGTLNVHRGVQADARGAVAVVDALKVESSRRTLALPVDLVEGLGRLRQSRPRRLRDALVFSRDDGQPLHPTTARKELADICRSAGVPVIRPNELRHSCASLLIDEGAPIERVADLLGHTTTRMVDTTYRHRVRPVVDTAAAVDWAQTR